MSRKNMQFYFKKNIFKIFKRIKEWKEEQEKNKSPDEIKISCKFKVYKFVDDSTEVNILTTTKEVKSLMEEYKEGYVVAWTNQEPVLVRIKKKTNMMK